MTKILTCLLLFSPRLLSRLAIAFTLGALNIRSYLRCANLKCLSLRFLLLFCEFVWAREMDAPFKIRAGRLGRCGRPLTIAVLVLAVFALGLHTKLALYQPASPSVLLTITKLSAGDRSAKAVLPPREQQTRMEATVSAAAFLFLLMFQHVANNLRHDRQRGFALAGLIQGLQYRVLFFRPPPSLFFA
jgi:hypothetical protein